MYDRLTVLPSKAEGLRVDEKDIQDAGSEDAQECVQMFRKLHDHDAQQVQEVRDHLTKMMAQQQGK